MIYQTDIIFMLLFNLCLRLHKSVLSLLAKYIDHLFTDKIQKILRKLLVHVVFKGEIYVILVMTLLVID